MREIKKTLTIPVDGKKMDFRLTKLDAFSGASLLWMLSKMPDASDNVAPSENEGSSAPFPALIHMPDIVKKTGRFSLQIKARLWVIRMSDKRDFHVLLDGQPFTQGSGFRLIGRVDLNLYPDLFVLQCRNLPKEGIFQLQNARQISVISNGSRLASGQISGLSNGPCPASRQVSGPHNGSCLASGNISDVYIGPDRGPKRTVPIGPRKTELFLLYLRLIC